jgi:hypothetical protein
MSIAPDFPATKTILVALGLPAGLFVGERATVSALKMRQCDLGWLRVYLVESPKSPFGLRHTE